MKSRYISEISILCYKPNSVLNNNIKMQSKLELAEVQRRNAPSRMKRFFQRRSGVETAGDTSLPANMNEKEFSSIADQQDVRKDRNSEDARCITPSAPPYPPHHHLSPQSNVPMPVPSTPVYPQRPPLQHSEVKEVPGVIRTQVIPLQVIQPVYHHNQQKVYTTSPQSFGQDSLAVVCPFCKNSVMSHVGRSCGLAACLVGAAIFMSGGVFGCCLIPCCINSLKDCKHMCPKCGQVIGKYKRLQMARRSRNNVV